MDVLEFAERRAKEELALLEKAKESGDVKLVKKHEKEYQNYTKMAKEAQKQR